MLVIGSMHASHVVEVQDAMEDRDAETPHWVWPSEEHKRFALHHLDLPLSLFLSVVPFDGADGLA